MKKCVFVLITLLGMNMSGYSQAQILPDLQEKIQGIGVRQEFIPTVVMLSD